MQSITMCYIIGNFSTSIRERRFDQVSVVHEDNEEEEEGEGNTSFYSDAEHHRGRRHRTASVDLRNRSLRAQGDGSDARKESRSSTGESPVRCQSAFTRDSVGRRSVSEKRHAHLSASSFKYYNENVLPLRKEADDQSEQLHFKFISFFRNLT